MVTTGPQDAKYLKQYLYYGTCSWYAPVSLTYSDINPEDVAEVLILGASHQHIPRRLLFAAMESKPQNPPLANDTKPNTRTSPQTYSTPWYATPVTAPRQTSGKSA
jgi:hypothetical protein